MELCLEERSTEAVLCLEVRSTEPFEVRSPTDPWAGDPLTEAGGVGLLELLKETTGDVMMGFETDGCEGTRGMGFGRNWGLTLGGFGKP